jgi:hypothetical protein
MSVTASNFLAGPGALWIASFGATEPADSDVANTFSASGWTDVGGTQDGVTVAHEREFFELECDQIVEIPASRETKRVTTVATNLAEPTLDNLRYTLNGGTVTASASYSSYDPDDAGASQAPTYWAVAFIGKAPGGFNRRLFVRKVLSVESVTTPYKKGTQTLYPVTFKSHYVSSVIKPWRYVDQTAA